MEQAVGVPQPSRRTATMRQVRAACRWNIPRTYPIRFPGTGFPGLIAAGSYTDFSFKRWAFFDLRNRRENVLIVEPAGWKYEVLVIEVRDARALAEMINAAIATLPRTEPAPPR
jgi:hypothetical protein